ncbi:CDP-glycerol glycerophosphotransferase family protein [Colwellia sp. C1TZA3]|uniref:CDP-glycerol glycerophosphotransferase family protein n=1 Tax=Colwellia sp. C1TZA3 TaxID=2508879 RepID=UPI0011BA1A61|nr:CDP-glycerol glycerophosphotransferase family protein [Colwellia sp. C1TZA3]TWX68457.1 CDP-glycerol--poly(glycerophosphate) glycerophosphotransferase [Colwellia sp. C1TZA3]
MRVFFDIQHLYYVPQYLPVKDALEAKNIQCIFILYQQEHLNNILEDYVKTHGLDYLWVNNREDAKRTYLEAKPDWIIFGNATSELDDIHSCSKTALMQHGIGPKSCYYDASNSPIMYRFVEGKHRLKRLQELFPAKDFIDTGYAKLDPIINNTDELVTLKSLTLDPNKKTILYAPTFYPSSIECLPKNFPELFKTYNLIIKPHFFSLIKSRYKSQKKKLTHWGNYENVYVCDVSDVSILPFMQLASLMISDASSTLFEFTALNKPAIWCDFYKLRWSYRGIFKFRFHNRLDNDLAYFGQVAERVINVKELVQQVGRHLSTPQLKAADRLKMSEYLIGKIDGNCSERIAEFIIGKNT